VHEGHEYPKHEYRGILCEKVSQTHAQRRDTENIHTAPNMSAYITVALEQSREQNTARWYSEAANNFQGKVAMEVESS
jgi:hypothetical protein